MLQYEFSRNQYNLWRAQKQVGGFCKAGLTFHYGAPVLFYELPQGGSNEVNEKVEKLRGCSEIFTAQPNPPGECCLMSRPHPKTHAQLVAEIKHEMTQLERTHQQLETRAQHALEGRAERVALAQLQRFYRHCERILDLLLWERQDARGMNWRHDLLCDAARHMAGLRPALISMQTRTELNRLLFLRNRVKNIYGYEPHPKCLTTLVGEATVLYPRLLQELTRYHEQIKSSFWCG